MLLDDNDLLRTRGAGALNPWADLVCVQVPGWKPASEGDLPNGARKLLQGARAESSVTYLDLEAIKKNGLSPVPWIITGWLAERDVAMQAGGAGIGKTTTLARHAIVLAMGPPAEWCGLVPSRAYKVLYFDEEQDDDTTSQLFIRLGAPHPNLRVASCQGIRLDTDEGAAWLEAEIIKHGAEVVFLDSVQQVFGAIPEIDNTALGLAYRRIFTLRDRHGVTFVLNHHKPKTHGETTRELIELVRGGTAHGTQCSTVWYAESGRDKDHLNLVQAKRRRARKTSLQIGYHEEGETGPITLTGEGKVEDQNTEIEVVSEWIVGYLSEGELTKKAIIAAAGQAEGHTEPTIERALAHLVRLKTVARPRRGYYVIAGKDLMETPTDGNLMER